MKIAMPSIVSVFVPAKPKHAMMENGQLSRSGWSCESFMKHG